MMRNRPFELSPIHCATPYPCRGPQVSARSTRTSSVPSMTSSSFAVAMNPNVHARIIPSSAGAIILNGRDRLERLFQALALRREQLGAGFRDQHVVLEPATELARDVDPRFVAERHSRFELQGV